MPKLHLILPMAGRGSRFFENGFVCPKPLIEIAGKPFFYWAARSIEKYVDCADLTFVVLEEHIRDFAIDAKIKAYWPNARIIALPAVTEGAGANAAAPLTGLKKDGAAAGAEQALSATGWLPRCLRTAPHGSEVAPARLDRRDPGAELGVEQRDENTVDEVAR